ncbi:MBL fold metallo-hydrolase [Streptomyces sp. NPDC058401]|uniref:MBL fold metallo-hydrolase n=1 Tax=Streptomyces sp. NPDC058401 TaxID=3346480 RepID=UPI00364669E1
MEPESAALSLTVLGSGAPYPQPGRACSGYLVRGGPGRVWVDAGPGTLASLQNFTRLETLSGVWLSHLHADHAADLLGTYYALALCGVTRPAPLPVYAPRGCAERLAGYFAEPATGFLGKAFAFHDLHDGHVAEVDGLRLVSRAVDHDVEAFGLRVEYAGASLAYSGDSAPCGALEELAADADLLLCEAGDDRDRPGAAKRHHTPEEAGELARRAHVREVVITHIAPALTEEEAVLRAARTFPGRIRAAREGATFPITAAARPGEARRSQV